MPFLALPRDRRLEGEARSRLASRLCPYGGGLERVPLSATYTAWTTPLVSVGDGRMVSRLGAGSADFEVAWSERGVRLSTDALGTCPLWFAPIDGGFVVSPEAKAIAAVTPVELRADAELLRPGRRRPDWSPYRDTKRLPPGCALELTEGEVLVHGEPALPTLGADRPPAGGDWAAWLGERLLAGFESDPMPTGAFISGGIDSSIACSLAARRRPAGEPLQTFTLGTVYGDEFTDARAVADHFGCAHREVRLEAEGLRAALDRAVFENELIDGLSAEVTVQLATLYSSAAPSCHRVATGYGSDLLFDGMLSHAAYMSAVGLETTEELIERTRWTGELSPFTHWGRGLAVNHVFWKPGLIAAATAIPRHLCRVDGVEKHVLRAAAVATGLLPRELAFREKRALSEGTGAHRLLSAALGLDEPYAYGEKSAYCIARLRRVLAA